jgi:UDP-N-acetylglucosamine--N-acetylmuramyl-(pentapeptide) pyrophosphoryl-undecaprenol N-acetylglucosamine transferase
MNKNFLITTGGSGGHVIPATILYNHLSKEANVFISSDKRGLKYLNKDIYKFEIINTPRLNNILLLPFNFILILFLTLKSLLLLKRKKIEKLISTGGYMSLPLILAARLLKINVYLIEPNQVLGRANKYFLSSCKKIFCYSNQIKNFPENFKYKITIINPLVKEEVYKISLFSKPKDKFNILVVGGSQGANIFDSDLKKSIVNISKKNPIKIIQQTSVKNIPYLKDFYFKNNVENTIFSFDENFPRIIQKADLCITRAGASTLAELSVLNIPFIAVPLPTSKDNHQYENANFYKNNDSCWIIEQNNFEEKIEEVLKDILDEKSNYLKKKENLKKLNYQNSWINVNQKILRSINEN